VKSGKGYRRGDHSLHDTGGIMAVGLCVFARLVDIINPSCYHDSWDSVSATIGVSSSAPLCATLFDFVGAVQDRLARGKVKHLF